MPKSSTPALLLMTVRSFVPRACSALIRFSGNAAQAEAAHHDRRAVGDQRDRVLGALEHLVHRLDYSVHHEDRGHEEVTSDLGAVGVLVPQRRSRLSDFAALPPAVGAAEHLDQPLASSRSARRSAAPRSGASSACPDLVGVGGGDVLPDSGRARREARGVEEPASGERQAVVADGVADDLHQRAGGQLRQMTEIGRAAGRARRPTAMRGSAPSARDERRQLFDGARRLHRRRASAATAGP